MNPPNGTSSSPLFSASQPLRLLVVEDDDRQAHDIEQAVRTQAPKACVRRAATVAEARRMLHESPFEAAIVTHDLPDGDSFDVLDHVRATMPRMPVVVLTRFGAGDVAMEALRAGASDCIPQNGDDSHLRELPARLNEVLHRHQAARLSEEKAREVEQARLLESMRTSIAAVKHEINNPLAIISGNAQLLLELGQVLDLDEELVKSIRDIQEASLRIAVSLDKLGSLKDILTRPFEQGDGSPQNLPSSTADA